MQMSHEKLRGLGWRPFAVGVTAATIATTGAVATTLVGAGGSGKEEEG